MKNSLPEFKCPLCHSTLESADYYQAIQELQKKVSETYGEENEKAKQDFEERIGKINEAHKEEIAGLKSSFQEQIKTLKAGLEGTYKEQFAELKKTYDKLGKENKKNFAVLERKLKADGKKELQEKEKQIIALKKEQTHSEKVAFEKGKADVEFEMSKLSTALKEKDVIIDRFKRDTEDLRRQLTQSRAEAAGEAGEIDLFTRLTQAFEQDSFLRQQRGKSMGDIVQKIRTASISLEVPIVYDNKQAEGVTVKDIEKAKKYKDVHATDYVIIVSSNLPKKDIKNGLFGEKEGILLCHPCIVIDVAKQLRRAIIEICKQSGSRKDREKKESKLYDYIRSTEFASTVEKLRDVYQKAADLQDDEERAHTRLWAKRKKLQQQINDVYGTICTGVDCIIQEKLPMQDLAIDKEEKIPELEPMQVKKRKKKQESEKQMV